MTAVAFSEDGKYLATYGAQDAKINFWQAAQTFLVRRFPPRIVSGNGPKSDQVCEDTTSTGLEHGDQPWRTELPTSSRVDQLQVADSDDARRPRAALHCLTPVSFTSLLSLLACQIASFSLSVSIMCTCAPSPSCHPDESPQGAFQYPLPLPAPP